MAKRKTPIIPPIPGLEAPLGVFSTMDELLRQLDAVPKTNAGSGVPLDALGEAASKRANAEIEKRAKEQGAAVAGINKDKEALLAGLNGDQPEPEGKNPPGKEPPKEPEGKKQGAPALIDKREFQIQRWIDKQRKLGIPDSRIERMLQRDTHIVTAPKGTMVHADTGKDATKDELTAFRGAADGNEETPQLTPMDGSPIAPAEARRDPKTGFADKEDWRRLTTKTPEDITGRGEKWKEAGGLLAAKDGQAYFDKNLSVAANMQRELGLGKRTGAGFETEMFRPDSSKFTMVSSVPLDLLMKDVMGDDWMMKGDDTFSGVASRRASMLKDRFLPKYDAGTVFGTVPEPLENTNPGIPSSVVALKSEADPSNPQLMPGTNYMTNKYGVGYATNVPVSQPLLPNSQLAKSADRQPELPPINATMPNPDLFKNL